MAPDLISGGTREMLPVALVVLACGCQEQAPVVGEIPYTMRRGRVTALSGRAKILG